MICNHLKSCWRCRSVLADLESQAEALSRLLSAQLGPDRGRFSKAKERFLQWRISYERRRRSLSKVRCSFWAKSFALHLRNENSDFDSTPDDQIWDRLLRTELPRAADLGGTGPSGSLSGGTICESGFVVADFETPRERFWLFPP